MRLLKALYSILIVGACLGQLALAEAKQPSSRQKVLDFEGDLVEGVNKRPLDSLSEVSEAQKRRKRTHLYKKRRGFRTEIRETLREMRYSE